MRATTKKETARFTATAIRRARGILKRRPRQKPLAEEWAVHKKHERKLDEAKHGVTTRAIRNSNQSKRNQDHPAQVIHEFRRPD